jgi:3',5'-cyclic AMP phosphodiesterase CpdA
MVAIAHISDLHFGDACAAALRDARDALNARNPDCIVVTGDITQSGRRSEFRLAAEWFAGILAPLVVCPGNHDAPVYSVLSRAIEPFGRFRRLGLESAWADRDGRAAVVAWNSARAIQPRLDWSQGVHNPQEIRLALDKAYSLAPLGWRVLACHHPPGCPPTGAAIKVQTRNADTTRDLLRNIPKTLLLCGHVHQFSKEMVGAAQIVTAPTLASSRERGNGCGFVQVELARDVALVTEVRLRRGG